MGQEISFWFASGDEPAVEEDETESRETDEWLLKRYRLTSQKLVIKGKVTKLDCRVNSLASLDVSSNAKLTVLSCYKNNLTFEKLTLPKLSAEGNLYFKDTDGKDSQKLTAAQVKEIKEKKWTVWQYKGEKWVEYLGE